MPLFTPLKQLIDTIDQRKDMPADRSYTAQLLRKGRPHICQKLAEESAETVIAAMQNSPQHVAEESADLLYHLCVLWAEMNLNPQDIMDILARRQQQSGLDEKAQRKDTSS